MKNIALFIFVLLLLTSYSYSQKTYIVARDGTGNFSSIAQVNSASLNPGDIVSFKSGQQFNDVTLVCKSGVTYSSFGTGRAVIGDSLSQLDPTIQIDVEDVTLDNLKIYGSAREGNSIQQGGFGGVIEYTKGGLTIQNCELVGGAAVHTGGFTHMIRSYVGNITKKVKITHNIIRDIATAIYLESPYNVDISFNEIYNIWKWDGYAANGGCAIVLQGSGTGGFDAKYTVNVHHNNIHHFEANAFYPGQCSKIIFEYNEIHHNLDERLFMGGVAHGNVGKMWDITGKSSPGPIGHVFRYNYVHDLIKFGQAGYGYSRPTRANILAGLPNITNYNTGHSTPIYYGAGNYQEGGNGNYGDESGETADGVLSGLGYANVWIHNNIFYNCSNSIFIRAYTKFLNGLGEVTGNTGAFLSEYPSYFYNNTIYNCASHVGIVGDRGVIYFQTEAQSPNYIKNNIFGLANSNSNCPAIKVSEAYAIIDYNIYPSRNGYLHDWSGANKAVIYQPFNGVISTSPPGIQEYYNTDPEFYDPMNKFFVPSLGPSGTFLPDLRIIENGNSYNTGEDLGNDPTGRSLKYDILGNLRNLNDIGALGTVGNGSQSPATGLRVILEAPYENGKMKNTLSSSNLIPLNQPYNVSPWNVYGDIIINNTLENHVDWILVQIKEDIKNTIYSKVGILTEDGIVLNPNGSPFSFSGLSSGEYYIVIKHRNHLGIMSAQKIKIEKNKDVVYDFTDSQSKAYGQEPMTNLGDGKYAMIAGDGDVNGIVNVLDFSIVANNILLMGYERGDIDMNGSINILDYSKINKNLLKVSQVPN